MTAPDAATACTGSENRSLPAADTTAITGFTPQVMSLIPPPKAVIPASSATAHTPQAVTSPPARFKPCRPATAATTNTIPATTAAPWRALLLADIGSATGTFCGSLEWVRSRHANSIVVSVTSRFTELTDGSPSRQPQSHHALRSINQPSIRHRSRSLYSQWQTMFTAPLSRT